jgi:hypothetical protein
MTEMIAYCGLDCHQCGAYLATLADNDDQRRDVAVAWSEEYDAELLMEDINCLGCLTDGEVLFHHCQVCEIRQCGQKMDIPNCAYCQEFPCSLLGDFFVFVPEAKERLIQIRRAL